MTEGFHAALLQLLPIARCPTHNAHLIQACPQCKSVIPYRPDPAASATPLACLACASPLVSDPTVRPFTSRHRQHQESGGLATLAGEVREVLFATPRNWPFSRTAHAHRQRDAPSDRGATAWWHRSWQGARARACSAETSFEDPPFGVAEWVAFSKQPASRTSRRAAQQALSQRFEQDLQVTWLAWSELLQQVPKSSSKGLHPMLIPPRGCWLAEPTFSPTSTALGS